MKNAYDDSLKKDGVFGVLNTASLYHVQGEKGAYKYALKYIRNLELEPSQFYLVFSILVNIMILDPKYTKYVIEFLKKNKSRVNIEVLEKIINNELSYSLNQKLQQESLLFLYIIHDLKLKITGNNINLVLNSKNDFAIIIALDIWMYHNDLVIRNKVEAANINQSRKKIAEELVGETYQGSRWLLLYEAEKHRLFPKEIYTPVKKNNFFRMLLNKNITFYIG